MLKSLSILALVGAFAAPAFADSAPTIDGVFNASDNWGASVETLNLTNPGGNVTINAYFTADATKVYGAFVADTSSAGWASRPGTFANIYVYSGTAVDPGGLGDGNDVLIQTAQRWMISDANLTNPYAGTSWNDFTGTGPVYSNGGVTVGWTGGSSNVIEFSIDKSLLGDFSEYKIGTQGWSYDIDPSQWVYVSADAASGTTPSTPLPASVYSGVTVLAALGLGRFFWTRRKLAC